MLTQKTREVRTWILDQLESGALSAGQKIPPARDLAETTGVTFLKVQQAIETLVQDGILMTQPRQGTFVRDGWAARILSDNLSVFNLPHRLPWLQGLAGLMADELPGLRFSHTFSRSMLELKTTLWVQQHQDQYMDLSELFAEAYPDTDDFAPAPFLPMQRGGRLLGVPFIYSPRVLFVNPRLLAAAGCELPDGAWDWPTFLDVVARLRRVLPADRILNWYVQPHLWLNFVIRAGGHIVDPQQPGRVALDSDASCRGLACFRELGAALGYPAYRDDSYREAFLAGEAAMMIHGRQFTNMLQIHGHQDWTAVPLPSLPGGVDLTSQATDVLCVRRECLDRDLARDYIRFMLSERVQQFVGEQRYGIPIRRSAAAASIDRDDPRDAVFHHEMRLLGSEPMIDSPMVLTMLLGGVDRLLVENRDLATGLRELADASRCLMDVNTFRAEQERTRRAGGDELAVRSPELDPLETR